jgi:two-component system, NarL family, invasion response regulator UvrY
MLRILVADDHEIVRKGIKQILTEEFSFVEIGEAFDRPSLVEKALAESWDIIISDLSMPGGGGFEAIKQILHQKPRQPILIVSFYPEEQYATRAFRAGASGFLNKSTATEELINAVRVILSGRRYLHFENISNKFLLQLKQAGLLPHELLSIREYEVMLKLAAGKSVAEIANELAVTSNTISTYRARLLEKMDMSSNAQLIKYAIENKLI